MALQTIETDSAVEAVNTNIKTNGLSSMLNIFFKKSPIVLAILIATGMLFQIKVPE